MRIKTRKLALTCIFGALYAVFSLVSLFPIIGALGRFITLATILAPILGMMLGPYIGAATASVGGFIGWSITQSGAFSFVSFIPGAVTALTAGLVSNDKRLLSVSFYLVLLLPMALFPIIGPVWLYPLFLWFQLLGLFILISPISSIASRSIHSDSIESLTIGVGVVALISTLTGQVAGSLMFESFFYPLNPQIEFWRTFQWQPLTIIYPIERGIVVFLATLIAAPLIRAVRILGFKVGGI